MKHKFWGLLAACVLLFTVICTSQAHAAGIQVTVDGKTVHFSNGSPYVDENGRTMIPLRAVADALGCETTWDNDRQSATVKKDLTIGGKSVTLSQIFYPNDIDFCSQWAASAVVGQEYLDFGLNKMNTRALVKNGSTYLPIRYVAEYFGYTVQWNGTTKTVQIKSGGEPGSGADYFTLNGPIIGNLTQQKLCGSVWVNNGYRNSDTNIYTFSPDGTLLVEWASNAIPLEGSYLLQGDTVIATTFDGKRIEYFDYDSEKNILVSRNDRKLVGQENEGGNDSYYDRKTTVEILKPYSENPYKINQAGEPAKESADSNKKGYENTPRAAPYKSVVDYLGLTVNDIANLWGPDFQYLDGWIFGTSKQICYLDIRTPLLFGYNDYHWVGEANGDEKINIVECSPQAEGFTAITEVAPNIPLQINSTQLTKLGYKVTDISEWGEIEFGATTALSIEYTPEIVVYFFWYDSVDANTVPASAIIIWNKSL